MPLLIARKGKIKGKRPLFQLWDHGKCRQSSSRLGCHLSHTTLSPCLKRKAFSLAIPALHRIGSCRPMAGSPGRQKF